MVTRVTSLLLLMFAGLILGSCDDQSTDSGSDVPRSITGKVILLNTDDNDNPFTDHSGVVVHLEGTSFSAITDSKGKYTLSDVPPDIYIITYTKPDFDSVISSVEYSGVGVEFLEEVRMNSKPTVHAIRGLVQLMDVDTDAPLTDHSGVTVSLTGTSFSTSTTAQGEYSLDNIPAGAYTIRYEKSGFDSVERKITYSGLGIYPQMEAVLMSHTKASIMLDPLVVVRGSDLAGHEFVDSVRSDSIFISGKVIRSSMLVLVVSGTTNLITHNALEFGLRDSTIIPSALHAGNALGSAGNRFTLFMDARQVAEFRDARHAFKAFVMASYRHKTIYSNSQPLPPID